MYNKFTRPNQSGISLIEVLVAVFILTAGLLGLASLQTMSLKHVNNTQFHSLATAYAYDMAERMRSNREAVTSGAYNNIVHSITDPACESPCTSTDIAQLDGFLWNQKIKSGANVGGLPQGQGSVTKDGSVYKIEVKWKEQQRNNTGGLVGDAGFTLEVQI